MKNMKGLHPNKARFDSLPAAASEDLAAAIEADALSALSLMESQTMSDLGLIDPDAVARTSSCFQPNSDGDELFQFKAFMAETSEFIRSLRYDWTSLVRKNPGVGREFMLLLVDPRNDMTECAIPQRIRDVVRCFALDGHVYLLSLLVDSAVVCAINAVNNTLSCYSRVTIESDVEQVHDKLVSFRERIMSKTPFAPTLAEKIVGYWVDQCIALDPSQFPAYLCKHGPGAVAETHLRNKKSQWINIYCEPLEYYADSVYRRMPFVEDWHEQTQNCNCTARVLCVPKDFRGPRIIAAEPVVHQYLQMGVDRYVRERVLRGPIGCAIHFDSQLFNQQAALRSSIDRQFATLDLSEASDTVRIDHVRKLLPKYFGVVKSLRTPRAAVTIDGVTDVVEHNTFATMGSALCFCTESLVFLIICLATYCEVTGIRPAFRTLSSVLKRSGILVFGDDIVVPTTIAERVMSRLIDAGFLPNKAKSCVYSHFRESCGVEAISGFDITRWRPRHLPGAVEYRWSSHLANIQNLVNRGLLNAASCLIRMSTFPITFVNEEYGMRTDISCPWVIYTPLAFDPHGNYERRRDVRIYVEGRRSVPRDFWRELEDAMRPHSIDSLDDGVPTTPDGTIRLRRVKIALPGWPAPEIRTFDPIRDRIENLWAWSQVRL